MPLFATGLASLAIMRKRFSKWAVFAEHSGAGSGDGPAASFCLYSRLPFELRYRVNDLKCDDYRKEGRTSSIMYLADGVRTRNSFFLENALYKPYLSHKVQVN